MREVADALFNRPRVVEALVSQPDGQTDTERVLRRYFPQLVRIAKTTGLSGVELAEQWEAIVARLRESDENLSPLQLFVRAYLELVS